MRRGYYGIRRRYMLFIYLICVSLLCSGRVLAENLMDSSSISFFPRDVNDSVAVVIGNKNYRRAPISVEYAHNDVLAMRDWLLGVGFRKENIILIKDATKADMEEVFGTREFPCGRMCRLATQNGDIFIYYSGHGMPGKDGKSPVLLPVDVRPESADMLGYEVDTIIRNVSYIKKNKGMNIRVFLMLEACFSGVSSGGSLLPVSAPGFSPPLPRGAGVIRIAAAQKDQTAFWDKEGKMGVFTAQFLVGASGMADEPYWGGNGDGKIQWDELRKFTINGTRRVVRIRYGREQIPSIDDAKIDMLPYSSPGASKIIEKYKDEMLWGWARKERTKNAYERYLSRCSVCAHKKQAQEIVNRLLCDKLIEEDEEEWKRANENSTFNAFKIYLKGCKKRKSICRSACAYENIALQRSGMHSGYVLKGGAEFENRKIMIMAIQSILFERGCYFDKIDGIIGKNTQRAVLKSVGEELKSEASIDTLRKIYYKLKGREVICKKRSSVQTVARKARVVSGKRRSVRPTKNVRGARKRRDPFPKLEGGVACFFFNGRRYCE